MPTKRIAEITGKEHRSVLRDVREMCEGLGITPVFATAQSCAIDPEGVIVEQYADGDVLQLYLDEHHCLSGGTMHPV